MLRKILLVSLAGASLAACTAGNDPYYRSSANNPPGWVDRNRDGRDDRTQGSYTNPNNPPGWVDRDRDGRDDRVEQRRTSYRSGGYYDSYGNWRSY